MKDQAALKQLAKTKWSIRSNKVATIIGALVGASTQEDNNNEVFTMPVAAVIGAITGLSMDFKTPVIQSRIAPEEKAISYSSNLLKSGDLKFDSTADNLIKKLKKQDKKIENHNNHISEIKEEISDDYKEIEEIKNTYRGRVGLSEEDIGRIDEIQKNIKNQESRIPKIREKIARAQKVRDSHFESLTSGIKSLKESGDSSIKDIIDALSQNVKGMTVTEDHPNKEGLQLYNSMAEAIHTDKNIPPITYNGGESMDLSLSPGRGVFAVENPVTGKYELRREKPQYSKEQKAELSKRYKDKVAAFKADVPYHDPEPIIPLNYQRKEGSGWRPQSSGKGWYKDKSVSAAANQLSSTRQATRTEKAERMVQELKGGTDTKLAQKIMSALGIKIKDNERYKDTLGNKIFQNRPENGIPKSDIKANATPKSVGTIINSLTPDADIDNIINSALNESNTPIERRGATQSAIRKILDHAKANDLTVDISGKAVKVKGNNGAKTLFGFPLTQYGTNGDRFIQTAGGTTMPVKSMNPLSQLLSNGSQFDFSQVGETGSNTIRVPGANDILRAYEPIDAVHFFGVNKDSANVANSLHEYIGSEDVHNRGVTPKSGQLFYKTGLGNTIGNQIELKHTLQSSAVDSSGKIISNGVGAIQEIPHNGVASEVSRVISALALEYPESMLYGTSSTSRKTSIVNPKNSRDTLISPVPNAARSGQGAMNRGSADGKVKGGRSDAIKIKKAIISGEGTVRAAPYLFGQNATFGDGFLLFDKKAKELSVSDYGKMTISPTGNNFDLNIDRLPQFANALKQQNQQKRIKMLEGIGPSNKEIEDATKIIESYNESKERGSRRGSKNSTPNATRYTPENVRTARKILKEANTPGIRIKAGDTIGYSQDGKPQKLPGYYSHARIHDAVLDESGNLNITYKGTYTPEFEKSLKLFSQSNKAGGFGMSNRDMATLEAINTLEETGGAEFRYNEGGSLESIRIKNTEENISRLGPLLGRDGDTFRFTNPEEYSHSRTADEFIINTGDVKGDITDSTGARHVSISQFQDMLDKESASGKLSTDSTILMSLKESGFDDLVGIGKQETIKDVVEYTGNYLKNFGIDDIMTYRHETDNVGLVDRIKKYKTNYDSMPDIQKTSAKTPLEFAKAESLSEAMYHTYTSESKIAPDIGAILEARQPQDGIPLWNENGFTRTGTIESISTKKLLLNKDDGKRLAATKAIRGLIGNVAHESDAFSPGGALLKMDSEVAVERGVSIHGSGNESRISWLAANGMMSAGVSPELMHEFAEHDTEAVHEMEMIRNNAIAAKDNVINVVKSDGSPALGRKHIMPLMKAASADVELRSEAFQRIFLDTKFDENKGMISFNLSENAGDLKSISFSTVKTGRSGTFEVNGKNILAEMDMAKLNILMADINVNAETLGTKGYEYHKKKLDEAVHEYKTVVANALTSDGQGNIAKRANAMIGKKSTIKTAVPVSGFVSDVIIPRLREESGTMRGFNVYSMDEHLATMKHLGMNPDDFELREVTKPDDFKYTGESVSNSRPEVYQLHRKYKDGTTLPHLEASTKEPAMGPMSTMFKEVLVTSENSGRSPESLHKFVGIPQVGDKTIESVHQVLDYDMDSLGIIQVGLEDKSKQQQLINIKQQMDEFVTETFHWQSKTGVKGKNKKLIGVDEMVKISKKIGISPEAVWAMSETDLAKKGVLRKTATPFVTSMNQSMFESGTFSGINGDQTLKEKLSGHKILHDLSENILKTQHAETAKSVAPVPEVFKAMETRKQFLDNKISAKKYSEEMTRIIENYTQPSKMDGKIGQDYRAAVKTLIDSDVKYSSHVAAFSKGVMSINAAVGERMIDAPEFFKNISETLTDVTLNRPEGHTIFKGTETDIVPKAVTGTIEELIPKAKKVAQNAKDVLMGVSNKGNLKKVTIGLAGIAATTVLLGREASTPASLDMGQDSDRRITPPTPMTNSAYLARPTNQRKSVSVTGLEPGIPSQRLNRTVHGDTITNNRVRDERG